MSAIAQGGTVLSGSVVYAPLPVWMIFFWVREGSVTVPDHRAVGPVPSRSRTLHGIDSPLRPGALIGRTALVPGRTVCMMTS